MSAALMQHGETGFHQDNELAALILSFNDVTERLKLSHETLGSEVRRLREQLEEKDRELERGRRLAALGEMAAGVAHEIRNPLGGIGLYASLLAKDLRGDGEKHVTAERILAGVKNLEAIVGDILMFAGGAGPRCGCAAASKIAEEVVALSAPQARLKRVRLESGAALQGVELDCDERQISRALLNLVLNALDAVGEGGTVRIDAATDRRTEGLAGFVVEDDGPGIPPDQLDRIFNPFFTTKDTGTGLGLGIVHRIAEAHGGRITAVNRPEGGAKFTLYVPQWQGTPK